MSHRLINFEKKVGRVWEWIFPSVIIALVLVIGQCVLNLLNGDLYNARYYSLEEIISPHGELLIVAIALVAESLSEIWRRQISRWQKNYIASFCIGYVIVSTYIYSGLTITPVNSVQVSILSFNMFICGFILCVICKVAGRS